MKLYDEETVIVFAGGAAGHVEWTPGYVDEPLEVTIAIALTALASEFSLFVAAATELSTLAIVHDNLSIATLITMPEVGAASTLNIAVAAPTLEFGILGLVASKDTYVDVIPACPADATSNHDLVDLIVDGVAATRRDCMVGWNLTGIMTPATATVIAATITLNKKAGQTVSSLVTLNNIGAANEGWTEADVRCSTIPPNTGSHGSFTPGANGDVIITLNASGRSTLDARLNTNSWSTRIICVAPGSAVNFQSKDGAGDTTLAPRLNFNITVP